MYTNIPSLHILTIISSLYDRNGQLKFSNLQDNVLLGTYNPEDGWRVHIDDIDPNRTIANLTDVSQVCYYNIGLFSNIY